MRKGDKTANSISRRCPPRFPSALWGFGSSFPLIVAHASSHAALNRGQEIFEEVFFRSVFQGGLARHIGAIPALVVASVIFGCFHLVTKTYAVIATLIGAYLGVLWLATENLLAPITTHAVYDFLALVYFLRAHVRQHRAARIKN
jgi:Type II CAAX prenyl endopeptidase Rce1-like